MAFPSRSLAVGVFRFVLVGLLAFVVLIGTTLLIAGIIAWLQYDRWDSPPSLAAAFVCGLVFWLFVAVFHLRRETHQMPFTQRDQFIAKAKTVLHEMGYALAAQQTNALSFRPRFHAYLFGGGIHLALGSQDARLTGPKVSLEIFRRCFRLLNHVQRVQLFLQEHRKFTDNVIKRVEVQLRLRPDQFEAVRDNVIKVLERDGTVICELNLLVHSEQGIRESTLDFQIRAWLEQRGIDCDIHKDIVQFVEVIQPEAELAC